MWSFCQFFKCQTLRTNAKPPIENVLATVLSWKFPLWPCVDSVAE